MIEVIYTGGTIGMTASPTGLAPGADMAGWLAGLDLDITLTECDRLIDSSQATPEDWQAIVDAIRASHAAGVVVLHGTDTLAYTAAALSLAGCDLPVVVTGSMEPFEHPGSDAEANVRLAVAAAEQRAAGVYVAFGGRVMSGWRVTKFSSYAVDGFIELPGPLPVPPPQWSGRFRSHPIAVVTCVPGMAPPTVPADTAAVIVRAYGAGTVPANLTLPDVPVVVTSQCPAARVDVDLYAAGLHGAQGAGTDTFELAYARLVQDLSAQP